MSGWMMKLAALALVAVPHMGVANDYVKIFHQDMESVYSQSWYADHLIEQSPGKHEIYVRGDGKMGDFFRVLWLDCDVPKYSRWLSVGAYLNETHVPLKPIKALRGRYC